MRSMTVLELRQEAEAARVQLPPLVSATELLTRRFDPLRWLVPGLLPQGLTMLAARPKIGKSWLALDLATAVATGGTFLGQQVEQGDVLYLALEDGDRRLQTRLAKLKAHGPGLARLQFATSWPRGEEGAAAVQSWIGRTPGARLVVADVLTKMRGERGRSERLYDADYADTALLRPPAASAVSVLAVHHTRKAEAADAIDTVSGTLGVAGAVDALWVLTRARGEDEAVLHLIGRDLENESELALRFDRDACRWSAQGPAWQVRIGAERRQVLDVLAEGPQRPVDIARALGKQQPAVRMLLQAMVADGQVDRGLDGRYRRIG